MRQELDDLAHNVLLATRLHNQVMLEENERAGSGRRGMRGGDGGGEVIRREMEKVLRGVVPIGYA